MGTDVQVDWDAPFDNYEAISAYDIVLLTSADSQVQDLTNCDGSDSTILANTVCSIPMANVITLTSLS